MQLKCMWGIGPAEFSRSWTNKTKTIHRKVLDLKQISRKQSLQCSFCSTTYREDPSFLINPTWKRLVKKKKKIQEAGLLKSKATASSIILICRNAFSLRLSLAMGQQWQSLDCFFLSPHLPIPICWRAELTGSSQNDNNNKKSRRPVSSYKNNKKWQQESGMCAYNPFGQRRDSAACWYCGLLQLFLALSGPFQEVSYQREAERSRSSWVAPRRQSSYPINSS